MKKLDVYIKGEVMDLCIPTEEFAKKSDWYSWFNSADISRYLEQGVYPNTPDRQVDFFNNIEEDRLVFIISNKNTYIGVISLSFINLNKKTANVAIVVNSMKDIKMAPFISLEAMARITEYAFNVFGLNRLEASQHSDLGGWRRWQQRMELIGYKLEGVHENKFIKGREVSDTLSLACTYDDYMNILNNRDGGLWDTCEKMKGRIAKLPRKSYMDIMYNLIKEERKKYYENIFSL
jgi:RimJ/RimL family protein N-acetyltransferase